MLLREIRTYLGPRGLMLLGCAVLSWLLALLLSAFFLPLPVLLSVTLLLIFASICISIGYRTIARSGVSDKIKNTELGAVVENIRDGVVVYDPNFRVVNMNRAAENVFGFSAHEVVGTFITPELVNNAHLRVFAQVIFPSLAPSINTISSEWPQIIDLSFEEPHLELHTVLNRIVDERGEVLGFLKLITDVTRENTILESKGEFITVAAHQLRTPLSALNWTLETIQKTLKEGAPADAAIISSIQEGWQLTQRSLKIINDLLDAARIEEGKFGFHEKDLPLSAFIKTITDEAGIFAKEKEITVRFSSNAKQDTVYADQDRLGIAISNFIDNAVKYNSRGGSVDVDMSPSSDGRSLTVRIADTGIGIPKEDLQKLSQKFYRGENATQLEPNGSGLGVYIAKNIIEQHGGVLNITSEEGRGTTVTFSIPLKDAREGISQR